MVKEVHAAHILCKTEKKALEVREKLAGGSESFAEMARKYSTCPSAKSGGDLGWFPRGYLAETAIEEAAFALQPGQYSPVTQTESGYHILYLVGRDPNHPLSPDARLTLQKQALADWLTAQKNQSTILFNP